MQNLKLFYKRVSLIHTAVVVVAIASVSVLNYMLWTYKPNDQFETLQTVLWPFVRPVLSLGTLGLLVSIAFDPHTVRVFRKLAYFNNK